MDFRILGPLEAFDGDRAIALGGTRQRALLALLLLEAPQVVSTDRLIEELWTGERGAEKALQVAISRLRKTLGRELIVTRPPGYELRIDAEDVDLGRFQALAAQGREALAAGDPAAASERLDEALAQWRGPALADLAHEAFGQTEIARLDDLRDSAQEDRIAASLELGHEAELVPELRELIARHPLRERLRGQLMLALYRSGRQAEALDAYAHARAELVEELGIEPGRELRELHEAILRQEPSLEQVTQAAEDADRSDFVGRERERDEMEKALSEAIAGRGRVMLVAGEPGVGKSRLCEELMAKARMRGTTVLTGRCWEAGGAPAYWPWVQILRAQTPDFEIDELQKQVSPNLDPDTARFRLFEAVTGLLKEGAQGAPSVLVLDDLHAADEPSLLLLQYVAREIAGSRLLIVCAFRDVDPTFSVPLNEALAELAREPHVDRISLSGLTEPDVAKFIEISRGVGAEPQEVKAIHDRTEGNPLFVGEVVRLVQAEGSVNIPPGVRSVIGRRVAQMTEPCIDLLGRASVFGREFRPDALAELCGVSPDQLLDTLDEAMVERVVEEVPGGPGRLRFGHVLMRDTLYEELTPGRRVQLHRDAGHVLERVYANDIDAHLAELAHHFLAAASSGTGNTAAAYARRAGDRAMTQLAYEEAVRLFGMALPLVFDETERCDLLLSTGEAQMRAGDTPSAHRSLREAAQLADRLGLPEQLARAALGYGGRVLWDVLRGDPHHIPQLERALAVLPDEDSPLRVRLLARLAAGPLRAEEFPPERRHELSEEALDMARHIGEPATLAYALSGYISAHHSPAFAQRQEVVAAELIRVGAEAGDPERTLEGHEARALSRIEFCRIHEAREDLRAMSELAAQLRQPAQDWFVEAYASIFALLEGDLIEAERSLTAAREVGEHAQHWNAAVTYGLQLYALRRLQGRLDEVEALVNRSAEEAPSYYIWRCVQAQTAAELGKEREARNAFAALEGDPLVDLPFNEQLLASASLLSEAAADLGDSERAEALHHILRPYSERLAISYPEICVGAVARYLGLSATTTERWDEAERFFEEGIEVNGRAGAQPWLAHTQRDYAGMLVRRGRPQDRVRAHELLEAAHGGYARLGMDHWAERARP